MGICRACNYEIYEGQEVRCAGCDHTVCKECLEQCEFCLLVACTRCITHDGDYWVCRDCKGERHENT
jgi:hypothetical protein